MTEPVVPGDAFGESDVEQLHEQHGGRFTAALRRVSTAMHLFAGATLVILLLWTVGDIVGRSFFSSPFRGTVELTEIAVVVLVYLGLAYAEFKDSHITVDLLFVRLGPRSQLAVRTFAGFVTIAVIALLTWRLFLFAGQLERGGYTTGVLRVPLYPVAYLGVLGSIAFGLAVLSNLIIAIRALRRDR